MKLTPLDIRHKEFRRAMRGYADVEVDEFLDQVADEYERVFKDNIDLSERVEMLENQVKGYKRLEETLQNTLISAQQSAEELKQNATKEAQLILHEAELKARQINNESYAEKQAIEQSIAKLRSAEQDFRFRFRQMLEGYLDNITEPSALTAAQADAESTVDFARRAEAIKAAIAREETVVQAPRYDDPEVTSPDSPAAAVTPERQSQPLASAAPGGGVGFGAVAPEAPGAEAPEPAPAKERILFGESDDLLADVDAEVDENDFKW